MIVKEIREDEFNEFANNHILKNFYQTIEYGHLMSHSDFQVLYIGGFVDNVIVAASLILYKTIGPSMKYGYAPRGFLVDYYKKDQLATFTKKVKDYFFKRGYAFIKINPEITFSKVDFNTKTKLINTKSKDLIDDLKALGYDKLKDNIYFESLLPKYTPVLYLTDYKLEELDSKIISNVKEQESSGITLNIGSENEIDSIYEFIKEKENKPINYYKLLFNKFNESNMIDLLLVELNYNEYVKYLQREYAKEEEKNEQINKEFNLNPNSSDLYNSKMKSDKILAKISSQIATSNNKLEEKESKEILACAFVIKHQKRITILVTGRNKQFEMFDIKTFLYYKLIEKYQKEGFLFIDLNGITADYSDKNPYKDLNDFKLKFKPSVYEYIGEFDLIINKPFYQLLWSTNLIQKEFYKTSKK